MKQIRYDAFLDMGGLDNQVVEVRGTWIPYRPATHYQPEEGGYFEIGEVWWEGVNLKEHLLGYALDSLEGQYEVGDE